MHTKLLILQSTSLCNLNCKYCYLPDRKINKSMSLKTLTNLLEFMKVNALVGDELSILWHSGEPLLMSVDYYRSCIDLINKSVSNLTRLSYDIQTNGTHISEKYCQFFIENNINIGLSIDGPKLINDFSRLGYSKKSSFDAVMKGVFLLKKHNIPFSIISVLTKNSLLFPDEIYKFYQEIKPVRVGFNIDEQEGINIRSSFERNPIVRKQFVKFIRRIIYLNENSVNKIEFRELDLVRFCNNSNLKNYPFSILTVSANGNFSTFDPELSTEKEFIYGNVNEDNGAISNNIIFKIHETYNLIKRGIEICKDNCNYFSICGGGNASNKYFENGKLDSGSTLNCEYMKKLIADQLCLKYNNAANKS